MLSRRDFYRSGSYLLGSILSLGLAIPGVAFLLDPLRRKGDSGTTAELTRLSTLPVGVPRAYPIIAERRDGWVKYPPEPVGTVWLVRQPEGAKERVVAFSGECPHLGCAISLGDGGKTFFCPCHKASYSFDGERINLVAPRAMDSLQVELSDDSDPAVIVHFLRFRSQTKEKTPLV